MIFTAPNATTASKTISLKLNNDKFMIVKLVDSVLNHSVIYAEAVLAKDGMNSTVRSDLFGNAVFNVGTFQNLTSGNLTLTLTDKRFKPFSTQFPYTTNSTTVFLIPIMAVSLQFIDSKTMAGVSNLKIQVQRAGFPQYLSGFSDDAGKLLFLMDTDFTGGSNTALYSISAVDPNGKY